MISGACPYPGCDTPFFIPIAPKCPAFEAHRCEGCGEMIWTHHSRWDPWSMTDGEFREKYILDLVEGNVQERQPPRSL